MPDASVANRLSMTDAAHGGNSPPYPANTEGLEEHPMGQGQMPAELQNFHWRIAEELPEAQRDTLLAKLKSIPRPPASLHKLIDPAFLAKANSSTMSDLVMAEPMIAAKVLATVNSPFYGLKRSVTSIGQAITFLGVNTVRNLCLQYMLAEAFKPSHPEAQRAFDDVWRASALANEVCMRLNKELELPDHGGLATQVVLGFVGHLAAASLLPASGLDGWLALDRLSRADKEQALMGLSSGEIGSLLMRNWGIPDAVAKTVRAADRILVTPATNTQEASSSNVFAYFCARLGERMTKGQIKTLRDYDPFKDEGPDTFHLNAHLLAPAFKRLPSALNAVGFQKAMEQMLNGDPVSG